MGPEPEPEPEPSPTCSDNTTWIFRNRSKWNCFWVRKWPRRRCKYNGTHGVNASTACPIACRSKECTMPKSKKFPDWSITLRGNKTRYCKFLKRKRHKRCGYIGTNGTFGYEACRQCGYCTVPKKN